LGCYEFSMFILSIKCDSRGVCVCVSECQFKLEEICIEWDVSCYRRQLAHVSLSTGTMSAYSVLYVPQVAGWPLAVNNTGASQAKLKLRNGMFRISKVSCLCAVGGGTLYLLVLFLDSKSRCNYFKLKIFISKIIYKFREEYTAFFFSQDTDLWIKCVMNNLRICILD
jgi:hypothetical protein